MPSIPEQLARGMGTFARECGCAQPTRCRHPYFVRCRDAGGNSGRSPACAPSTPPRTGSSSSTRGRPRRPPRRPNSSAITGRCGSRTSSATTWAGNGASRTPRAYEYEGLARDHLIPELGSRRVEACSPLVVGNHLTTMDRLGTRDPTRIKAYVLPSRRSRRSPAGDHAASPPRRGVRSGSGGSILAHRASVNTRHTTRGRLVPQRLRTQPWTCCTLRPAHHRRCSGPSASPCDAARTPR